MARKVTLFTGQWADLPIAKLAKMAKKFGYNGLEPGLLGRPLRRGEGRQGQELLHEA